MGTPASTLLGRQPYTPKPTPKLIASSISTTQPEPPQESSTALPAAVSGSTYATTYYTYDLRGNTTNRVDQNANVVTSAYYNAYGARGSTNYDDDPYDGFGGQYGYRKDAGGAWMYLCGARYYSPDEARFVNRDPIGYAGGVNLYSYVANNPMNGVDPSGSNWQAFVVGGLVTGAFIVAFTVAGPITLPALLVSAGSGIVWGYLTGRLTGDSKQQSLTDAVGGSAAGLEGGQLAAGAYGAWRLGGGGSARSCPSGGGGEGGRAPVLAPLDPVEYNQHPDSSPFSASTPPGNYVYVRNTNGIVNVLQDGAHQHPLVFGGGQSATGAGTLTVGSPGVVTSLDNISGTFRFGGSSLGRVVDSIYNQGGSVRPGGVQPFSFGGEQRTP